MKLKEQCEIDSLCHRLARNLNADFQNYWYGLSGATVTLELRVILSSNGHGRPDVTTPRQAVAGPARARPGGGVTGSCASPGRGRNQKIKRLLQPKLHLPCSYIYSLHQIGSFRVLCGFSTMLRAFEGVHEDTAGKESVHQL